MMRWNGSVSLAAAVAVGLLLGAAGTARAACLTEADCPCADDPADEITIVTIGKGQSAAVNANVSHTIIARIVGGPSSLGGTAHRIPICVGTPVTVVVTNADTTNSRSLSIDDRAPLGFTQSDETATASFDMPDVNALYIATNKVLSGGGSDTDRMTLLPRGEPPPPEPPVLEPHLCVLDDAGFFCSASFGPCMVDSDCPGSGEFCIGNSRIEVFTQNLAAIFLPLSGTLQLNSSVVGPATGYQGAASCDIVNIDSFTLGVIGEICVTPATEPCDLGEIDCDGGTPLDIESRSNHDIDGCRAPGGLTEQLGCAANCETYCAMQGLASVGAGCEGFCTEGTQRDCSIVFGDADPACAPLCDTDSFCASIGEGSCSGGNTCLPVRECNGGTNDGAICSVNADCPGGACEAVPQFCFVAHATQIGDVCGCNCVGIGGSPSRPGGVTCNLGASIKVVPVGRPCTDPPSIDVGEACIPVTTEKVTNELRDANLTGISLPGNCLPPCGEGMSTGVPTDCELLASSITAGTGFAGAVNFFDSPRGDRAVNLKAACQ